MIATAADMALVSACGRGCSRAIAGIRARFDGEMRRTMLRCRLPEAEVDEALARVWTRLLVGSEGGPPRIGSFAGSGSLRAWLRRCAAHEALATLRRRRPVESGLPGELIDERNDPERRILRSEHAAVVREAFGRAIATLEDREREVLKLAILDGESSVAIAARYDVHRVTVARWLASAREKLARRTTRMLRDRCGPFARVAMSQVEITLRGMLTCRP